MENQIILSQKNLDEIMNEFTNFVKKEVISDLSESKSFNERLKKSEEERKKKLKHEIPNSLGLSYKQAIENNKKQIEYYQKSIEDYTKEIELISQLPDLKKGTIEGYKSKITELNATHRLSENIRDATHKYILNNSLLDYIFSHDKKESEKSKKIIGITLKKVYEIATILLPYEFMHGSINPSYDNNSDFRFRKSMDNIHTFLCTLKDEPLNKEMVRDKFYDIINPTHALC